jgi:ATP adenylyltransferase
MEERMEILHTPWRRTYVLGARSTPGCLFCGLLAEPCRDDELFILRREPHGCLMLNAYPYTPGHMMAIPYRHAPGLADLPHGELLELLQLAQLAERLLRRAYGCRAVHIGANLGAAAGAGVPEHLHLHIVARPESPLWDRCAEAVATPETLSTTRARLEAALAELARDPRSPARPETGDMHDA